MLTGPKPTYLTKLPDDMSFEQAAAIPHAGALAFQALYREANLRKGHDILINGAGGGVGTLGVQLAKNMAARSITGVDSVEKLSCLKALGFDNVFGYEKQDFTRLKTKFDIILDPKSNRSVFKYLRVLKPGGVYVAVGGSTWRLLQIVVLSKIIRLITGKTLHVLALKPNQSLDNLSELFRSGKLSPVLDHVYSLDSIKEGVHKFGEAKHIGKIIISMGET